MTNEFKSFRFTWKSNQRRSLKNMFDCYRLFDRIKIQSVEKPRKRDEDEPIDDQSSMGPVIGPFD